jgi:hypothetical protein
LEATAQKNEQRFGMAKTQKAELAEKVRKLILNIEQQDPAGHKTPN